MILSSSRKAGDAGCNAWKSPQRAAWILGSIALFSILATCGKTDIDPEKVIQEIAAERIESFRANFSTECQEKVLAAAKQRADSLILDRARRMRTLDGRPPRPLRPGEVAPKVLASPLPLRPLFPFEIRFDTLLRDSLYRDSLRLDSLGLGWPPIDTSPLDSSRYEE